MAHVGPVRLALEPMVTSDGKSEAQTTKHFRTFSSADAASQQVPRGSKRPVPRRNFGDPVHGSLRYLLVRRVYSQPRAASWLGHPLRKRCADCGRE